MSSTNPSPLSALEAASRDLAPAVCDRLAAICRAPLLHARFLNTLSLMEHIGSRKIMASQSGAALSADTLKHLAEETRHAFFFKRAAESLAHRPLDYAAADVLAGASARAYMGRLDAAIAQVVGAPSRELSYLYMSLIVELRAIWFYRLYQGVLTERAAAFSLKGVLAEEEHHLSAMLAQLRARDTEWDCRFATFARIEDRRFRALWHSLEADSGCLNEAAE